VNPNSLATSIFYMHLAHPKIMRDRIASACAFLRRAVQRMSVARSSELTLSSAFGRPTIHIPQLQSMSPRSCYIESLSRDTSYLRVERQAKVSSVTVNRRSASRTEVGRIAIGIGIYRDSDAHAVA